MRKEVIMCPCPLWKYNNKHQGHGEWSFSSLASRTERMSCLEEICRASRKYHLNEFVGNPIIQLDDVHRHYRTTGSLSTQHYISIVPESWIQSKAPSWSNRVSPCHKDTAVQLYNSEAISIWDRTHGCRVLIRMTNYSLPAGPVNAGNLEHL